MLATFLGNPARLMLAVALPSLLVAADALPRTSAKPAVAALRYTFTNSATTGRGTREEINLAGTGTVSGDDVRIEIRSGGKELMVDPGDFVLVKGREGTITAVDVSGRRYFQVPTNMLQLGLAGMTGMLQSMIKLEVSGLETRGAVVGAGPSVAGYPTTVYRVSQRYVLSVTAMGLTKTEKVSSEIDFHVASAVMSELNNPFMQVRIDAAEMIPGGETGLGEIVRQVVVEQEKLFRGTPVKTVTRSTSVDQDGKETTSTATNQITSITRVDVSPSLFTVPDGYTLVDNPFGPLAGGKNGESGSSIPGGKLATEVGDAAKDGAKQGLKDEVRNTARDAVTKKVRGIFRKP